MALGAKPCHYFIKDVDAYEKQRDDEIEAELKEFYRRRGKMPPVESPKTKTPRRRRKPFEFSIPCRERIMILHWDCSAQNEEAQAAGTTCTGADIKRVIQETQKTKRQRQTSKTLRETEDMQMVVERCRRKMKNVLMRRRNSQQQSHLNKWANSSIPLMGVEHSSALMVSETRSILKSDEDEGEVDV